jgi:hypothetical protein
MSKVVIQPTTKNTSHQKYFLFFCLAILRPLSFKRGCGAKRATTVNPAKSMLRADFAGFKRKTVRSIEQQDIAQNHWAAVYFAMDRD